MCRALFSGRRFWAFRSLFAGRRRRFKRIFRGLGIAFDLLLRGGKRRKRGGGKMPQPKDVKVPSQKGSSNRDFPSLTLVFSLAFSAIISFSP